MIGEDQTNELAGHNFKRVNVEYATPRHGFTGWVKDRYNEGEILLTSPIRPGKDEAPDNYPGQLYKPAASDAKAALEAPPSAFTDFDIRTVELGIRMAVDNFLANKSKETELTRFLTAGVYDSTDSLIIKANQMRNFFIPGEAKTKDDLTKVLTDLKQKEAADLA